jgi:hypothetical protein
MHSAQSATVFYNPAMPAYVVRIQPKRVDETPVGHLIDYSDRPDWNFEVFEAADNWREVLAGMNVTVGVHQCQFEVEELQPNSFAIVCKTHPKKENG